MPGKVHDLHIMHKVIYSNNKAKHGQGFLWVSSGAEIRPLSQWDLDDFFPNLKINPNLNFFFFRNFIQSPHIHKLRGDNLLSLNLIFLQFNGKSMCNSSFVF